MWFWREMFGVVSFCWWAFNMYAGIRKVYFVGRIWAFLMLFGPAFIGGIFFFIALSQLFPNSYGRLLIAAFQPP